MFSSNKKLVWVSLCLSLSQPLFSAEQNQVSIEVTGDQRCITSNGLPDHSTGKFPNSGNPNAISSQSVKLCFPTTPIKGDVAKAVVRGSIGVALNGVQMRPGTADYYDASSKRGFSRDRSSGWNLEGLGARTLLGMDNNNAHVDSRGLYHYHGVAPVVAKKLSDNLLGYAADGFAIYYLAQQYKSSHQLKTGTRPSGPGGEYDGTYNEDWEYVQGSGNLDQCNGTTVDGQYSYFATDSYPFFPRCLWGEASADFVPKRKPSQDQDNAKQSAAGKKQQGAQNNRQQPRRTPPPEAITACESKQQGDSCSFNAPRRNTTLQGTCRTLEKETVVCRPKR